MRGRYSRCNIGCKSNHCLLRILHMSSRSYIFFAFLQTDPEANLKQFFQTLVNFASEKIDEIFNGGLGSSLLTAGTAENVWICPAYPRPALPSTGACRTTSTGKQSLWVIGKKRHGYEHWQENKTQFIHDVCWIVLSQLVCRSEISLPLYTFYLRKFYPVCSMGFPDCLLNYFLLVYMFV